MLRMRAERGLSVFSALLALGLSGAMLVVGIQISEEWSHGRRHAAAARDLVVLARAARAHAANALDAMRSDARIRGGMREVDVATIVSDGWLDRGFPLTNALGQSYRVFHRVSGTDGLNVLVTTVTPSGIDVGYRLDAAYDGAGDIFVGVVDALEPRRLRGPAIDAEVEPYQVAFGEPSVGETGAIAGLTMRSVYGSELHRLEVAGYPDANKMETDLVMGGHDILEAGLIDTTDAVIANDLTLLGGLEVAEQLIVGQRLEVAGEATFEGNLRAREGVFEDVLVSDAGDVEDVIRATSLDIVGEVSAQTVRATSAMTAPSVSTTELHAAQVVSEAVRSDDIQARELRSQLLHGRTVTGDTGVYRLLITGGCTGC